MTGANPQSSCGASRDVPGARRTSRSRTNARQQQHELAHDINYALQHPRACSRLQDLWDRWDEDKPCRIAAVPVSPIILARQGYGDASPGANPIVGQPLIPAGDPLDVLLDRFCALFKVDPTSETGRQMRVGIVPLNPLELGVGPHAAPSSLLCVTNVSFRQPTPEDPRTHQIDPFSAEAVEALNDLGSIISLARQVAEHDNLAKHVNNLNSQFLDYFHRLSKPLRIIKDGIAAAVDGNVPSDLAWLFDLAWRLMAAQHETVKHSCRDGDLLIDPPVLTVKEIVTELLHLFRYYFKGQEIAFHFPVPDDMLTVTVRGELTLLQSILITLLDNAYKATEVGEEQDDC